MRRAGAANAAAWREAVRAGDRRAIAKTITLLESTRPDHAARAQEILDGLLPYTGQAVRLGITGSPGVGKSSFIEALGLHVLGQGRRVAVLAIDPSSPVSGGSILGDKTRMERLAQEKNAYIRPSPSGGSLGGVAQRTRETLLLCEAAGFDAVIVETVGVGQSEVTVASMVDCFLVLLQPGAGDALQGIKKGVLELADVLVVHKADGEQKALALRAAREYAHALALLRPASAAWRPPVLAASARTGEGVAAVWEAVLAHRAALGASGDLDARRRSQARAWLWSLLDEGLRAAFREHPGVRALLEALEQAVAEQRTTPAAAARELLAAFRA